jgi:hypothetical protein
MPGWPEICSVKYMTALNELNEPYSSLGTLPDVQA